MRYFLSILLLISACQNKVVLKDLNDPKPDPPSEGIVCELQSDGKTVICPADISQGEKGDQGDIGPQGLPGPAGADGLPGAKGDKGDTGAQGVAGIQGAQGIAGVPGAKGDKGDTGLQGLAGAKGDTGDQGIQGVQGIQGEKGDPGSSAVITKTDISGAGCTIILVGYSVFKNAKNWDVYTSEDCSTVSLGKINNQQVKWLEDSKMLTLDDDFARVVEF